MQVGITRPCTKWNTLVRHVRDIPRAINEAFVSARARARAARAWGRPPWEQCCVRKAFGRVVCEHCGIPAAVGAPCPSSPSLPATPAPRQAIATSGRPGPVLVDLPKDVTAAKLTERPDVTPRIAHRMAEKSALMESSGGLTPELRDKLARLINGAKRPVIYAGQGVLTAGAVAELRELAERGNIPVTTTLLGASSRV
jgi:thiamine pyrophosphate-dependent acetolactate synthase large subunit-like protein